MLLGLCLFFLQLLPQIVYQYLPELLLFPDEQDLAEVLELLRSIHYTGYLTIECLGPAAREEPVATARRDLDLLRSYMAS